MTLVAWPRRIARFACGLAGGAILALTLLVTADITARAMSEPLFGASDIGSMLLVMLIFLAMGATQAERGHVSMDALVSLFPARLRGALDRIGLLVTLLVVLVLAYGSVIEAWDSFHVGETSQISSLPVWPAKFSIAIGFIAFAVVLASQVVFPANWIVDEDAKTPTEGVE